MKTLSNQYSLSEYKKCKMYMHTLLGANEIFFIQSVSQNLTEIQFTNTLGLGKGLWNGGYMYCMYSGKEYWNAMYLRQETYCFNISRREEIKFKEAINNTFFCGLRRPRPPTLTKKIKSTWYMY